MKTILVIGGSYFAGRVFVQELVKTASFSVSVLSIGRISMLTREVKELCYDRHDLESLTAHSPSARRTRNSPPCR